MIFSVTTYCAKSNGFVTYQPLGKKKIFKYFPYGYPVPWALQSLARIHLWKI